MEYCPICGTKEVECTLGINGSDYMYCHICKERINIFVDEQEYIPIESDIYDHTQTE